MAFAICEDPTADEALLADEIIHSVRQSDKQAFVHFEDYLYLSRKGESGKD